MKLNTKWTALTVATVIGTTALVGPAQVAEAQKGRRNTTIAAGVVTAYGLLKGNNKLAILGGLGTAVAYKRYRDAKKSRQNRTIGQVFGKTPVYDSRRNRYGTKSKFIPKRVYYDARGQRFG